MSAGRRLSPDRAATPGLPSFPFGPGRGAYSRRTRGLLAVVLAALAVVAVVIGVVLATGPRDAKLRVVTIPLADRSASAALLRAAEAVGFEPRSEPGAGEIEDDTVVPARVGSSPALLAVGRSAPPFALRTPTGALVSLHALRGHVVLLEFFATWCPHCAAEAPHLERLYASLPHPAYSFVAVNADGETAPSILAYHIYFGLAFPALVDPSRRPGSFTSPGSAGPVTTAYKVRSLPTFYILGPTGRVVWAAQGEQPDLLLRRELRLAASAPAS